jgi:hypothetical protein
MCLQLEEVVKIFAKGFKYMFIFRSEVALVLRYGEIIDDYVYSPSDDFF